MKQPLAIVGASARAAAASAARAGFQPLAADLFADLDLCAIATSTRISPYPDGFLDWLRAVEPPAWMYTGALENHPELVDQMAWIAPLWGNSGEVLARVRSPWELGDALRDAGLLFPETRPSSDGLPQDGSWLAKTYRGASGSGVREWSKGQGAGSEEDSHINPVCFQKRIQGTACAAVYVAAGRTATLLGVMRQLVGEPWLGAHGFQYAGSIGPLPLDETAGSQIARCGQMLAERFELTGLFGVDFVLDREQQLWALEVNPRYTASVEIIERATGVDAVRLHATACNDMRLQERESEVRNLQSTIDLCPVHGKAILYAKRDVVIPEKFAAMALTEASRQPWPTVADISPARTMVGAGRPVLTVFDAGSTDHEVNRRLRERVATIEDALYLE